MAKLLGEWASSRLILKTTTDDIPYNQLTEISSSPTTSLVSSPISFSPLSSLRTCTIFVGWSSLGHVWNHRRHHYKVLLYTLLILCVGNPPVTGGFPAQKLVMGSFEVCSVVSLGNLLNKHSSCRRFWDAMPLMWRHWNAKMAKCIRCKAIFSFMPNIPYRKFDAKFITLNLYVELVINISSNNIQ